MCVSLIRPCHGSDRASAAGTFNLRLFVPQAKSSHRSRKTGEKCQMTCKPGSVTAAIAADDGYSSRMAVTSHLKQPTRT